MKEEGGRERERATGWEMVGGRGKERVKRGLRKGKRKKWYGEGTEWKKDKGGKA